MMPDSRAQGYYRTLIGFFPIFKVFGFIIFAKDPYAQKFSRVNSLTGSFLIRYLSNTISMIQQTFRITNIEI